MDGVAGMAQGRNNWVSTQAQGQIGANIANNAPKPIGLMQRTDGVRTGLAELQERLEVLAARIMGGDGPKTSAGAPISVGIPNILDASEAHLRDCLRLVGNLNDTF